jgi:two-component system, chemotaxis family, protein-glutamate methylesterase/glutaminase
VEPVRVLLVDDSPFVQRAVERMLEPVPAIQVVGTASDGAAGVEGVKRLRPDVVVLDIDMPGVNGLEAIRTIMEVCPTPILILSSHARPGAEVTLKALELGAVDFVSKSQAGTRMDIYELAPLLREKVLAVAGSRLPAKPGLPAAETGTLTLESVARAPTEVPPAAPRKASKPAYDLLVVGSSTGGPRALSALLGALPAEFPAAILVAQHMPPGFTATLAERLGRRSAMTVREARDGDALEPGVALIGPGGRHLRVDRGKAGLIVRTPSQGLGYLHRPSVDLLFTSAAATVGARTIGLILTGMGQDGAEGLAAIRKAGGRTMTESEESAVIFGMPAAAADHADQVLPLQRIPAAILDLFKPGGH